LKNERLDDQRSPEETKPTIRDGGKNIF
jgi:hypothetical protein